MPAVPDDFKHIDNHDDFKQLDKLHQFDIDLVYQQHFNQLNIQHDNDDHNYSGTMHRRMYLAMERGRPNMAEIRSRQLLGRMLVSSADITGNDGWRVSDSVVRKADMSGVLRECGLLSCASVLRKCTSKRDNSEDPYCNCCRQYGWIVYRWVFIFNCLFAFNIINKWRIHNHKLLLLHYWKCFRWSSCKGFYSVM